MFTVGYNLFCTVSKSIQFTMKAVINHVGGCLARQHVDEKVDKIISGWKMKKIEHSMIWNGKENLGMKNES